MECEKVIVVSGGTRGLGQFLVGHFLDKGWKVGTFGRRENDFITNILMKPSGNKNFYWKSLDINETEKLPAFFKAVFMKFRRIDALINNAGVGTDGILTLMSSSQISNLIDINLKSAIQLSRACLKYFLINKSGNIINISSI